MNINDTVSLHTYRNYSQMNKLISSRKSMLSGNAHAHISADAPRGFAASASITARVRHVNSVVRDTQDATGLVKAARDAAGHIGEALQRMGSLVEQADGVARDSAEHTALQREYAQLQQDINDTVRQASFRGTRLLDGSLSGRGVVRSAQTVGIDTQVLERTAPDIIHQNITMELPEEAYIHTQDLMLNLGYLHVQDAAAGDMLTVRLGETPLRVSLKEGKNNTRDIAQGLIRASQVSIRPIAIEGREYSIEQAGGTMLRLRHTGVAPAREATMKETPVALEYTTRDGASPAQGMVLFGNKVSMQGIAPVQRGGSQPVAVNKVQVVGRLKVGDVFRISGKQFELVVPGGTAKTPGTSTISVFAAQANQDIIQAMKDAVALQFQDQLKVEGSGNEIRIEQLTPGDGDVRLEMDPLMQKSTHVQFDIHQLRTGDQVTLQLAGEDGQQVQNTYHHMRGNGMQELAEVLTRGTNGVQDGNALTFESAEARVQFTPVQDQAGRAVQVQTGVREDDKMYVDIPAMNTAGLGLDGTTVADGGLAVRAAQETVAGQATAFSRVQDVLQQRIAEWQQTSLYVGNTGQAMDAGTAGQTAKNAVMDIQRQMGAAEWAQANSSTGNVLALLM